MDVITRAAVPQDTEKLMEMQLMLFRKWSEMDPIDKADLSWFGTERHRRRILDLLDDNSSLIIVALAGNLVVGYAKAEIEEREPFLKKTGYISETFVLPDYRGKNIGTALFLKVIEWFKKKGIAWTTVSTHSSDEEANRFWQAKGYKEFNKIFKMMI